MPTPTCARQRINYRDRAPGDVPDALLMKALFRSARVVHRPRAHPDQCKPCLVASLLLAFVAGAILGAWMI
jgi:hypothetical protein